MVAPGMTAPLVSATFPATEPVTSCAAAELAIVHKAIAKAGQMRRLLAVICSSSKQTRVDADYWLLAGSTPPLNAWGVDTRKPRVASDGFAALRDRVLFFSSVLNRHETVAGRIAAGARHSKTGP